MVSFSGEAATPTGYRDDGRDCHSERLADATPINIKYMVSYVDSLSAGGKNQLAFFFMSLAVSDCDLLDMFTDYPSKVDKMGIFSFVGTMLSYAKFSLI